MNACFAILAQNVTPLVDASGQTTAVGAWLLLLLSASAVLLVIANQVLGFQLKRKQLNAPPAANVAQPFIVSLEEKFVSAENFADHKEEARLRAVGLEKQISDARHSFDERANTDLRRTLETFADVFKRIENNEKAIGAVDRIVGQMEERTQTHIRQLDANDTKMNTLLREVSAAAAVLKSASKGSQS